MKKPSIRDGINLNLFIVITALLCIFFVVPPLVSAYNTVSVIFGFGLLLSSIFAGIYAIRVELFNHKNKNKDIK